MSDNNTASPGYLLPAAPDVPYDDDLLDLLQPVFAGVSGIPGPMFRPRFQIDDLPNQPEHGETWASLGIREMRTDTFAHLGHDPAADGSDVLQRSEEHDVQLSFYGPRARACAERTRDGLSLGQNRDALLPLNMAVVGVGSSVALPMLLASKYQRRVDVTVTLRRCVERRYGVLTVLALSAPDIASVPGPGLDNGLYLTPIQPREPPA